MRQLPGIPFNVSIPRSLKDNIRDAASALVEAYKAPDFREAPEEEGT